MPLSEAQINAKYIALGCDAVWPMRGNLNEVLGLYASANGTPGAGIAYTTAGPESARTSNVATFSGAANSYADFGSLANVGSRVAAGGGLTVGFWLKIPASVTAWRVGTLNTVSTQYLYYDCNAANNQVIYRRNNAESSYIDVDLAIATSLRDNNWHHIAFTYNHKTGVIRTFLDGEPWNDGFGANRATANDALTVNVANWMMGAYAFNGGAAAPYVSAHCELVVASKCMSDEEVRSLKLLGAARFNTSWDLPLRVGPVAETVACQLVSDLRTRSPLLVVLGDSTLTSNGQGNVAAPDLLRQLSDISGGRLSNWEIRVGDNADSNAPPGRVATIAAAATAKYLANARTNDINTNDPLVGSDNTVRRSFAMDATQGFACTIGFRKESGGRGPINYVLRGSDWQPANNPITGAETYQTTIASGQLFSAAELTGNGVSVAYKTVQGPASARYRYYQIELTNTGGSTATLVDLEFNSVKNAAGPAVKLCTHGGYKISDFYGTHPNWAQMIKDYRTFRGSPPLHIMAVLGPNDGANLDPAAWYTAFSSFCASLFADFPDAMFTMVIGPPVDGSGLGCRNNDRIANMVGAVEEYAIANPSQPICGANARRIAERTLGWTPWTQTTARFNVIGEYAAATTYAQSNVVWTRTNDAATIKRYWLSRFNAQTGVSLVNVEKWTEVLRYLSDGTHHTEEGARQFVNMILRSALGGPVPFVNRVWT